MTDYTGNQTARLPVTAVAASIFGLWVCYYALTTLRGAIVGLELQDAMLLRRAIVTVAGIAITLGMWLLLRLFDARPLWMKITAALLIALPASVLIAQVNQMAFADIEAQAIEKIGEKQGVRIRMDEAGAVLVDVPGLPRGMDDEEPPAAATVTLQPAPHGIERWRQLTDIALARYFLLLAWAALYLALLAGAQASAAERREGEFRRAAKAAELRSLRYQVNPHFLFNTLNSLSALVMTGKAAEAERMIQTISTFYRHSLADEPSKDVALADEFALQRDYLAIESVRFPERLRSTFDLPEELAEARVPGMILQPLIENSVKYAVAPIKRPVTISVSAHEEQGQLVITVKDDGPGAPAGVKPGFGIGLANVRDRLLARFGKQGTIAAGPVEGGYVSELRMPLVRYDL